jgi:hypothetical protein
VDAVSAKIELAASLGVASRSFPDSLIGVDQGWRTDEEWANETSSNEFILLADGTCQGCGSAGDPGCHDALAFFVMGFHAPST